MKKRAALYDPYLDVMGGGERHALSILQALESCGFETSVFWNENLGDEIKSKLNITFNNLSFNQNIFETTPPLQKLSELKKYDILLYVTDGSYFFSSAKKTVVFCMVPNKSLYKFGFLNRLKTLSASFISNSAYTQKWLKKWGIHSEVLYPYISPDFINEDPKEYKKEKMILSVGRFFPHLHSKKHQELIGAFQKFQKNHPDYSLVLAGGIKKEDEGYLEELKSMIAGNKNITIKANLPYKKLLELYKHAKIFWHFAGYGIQEEESPHLVEHLGMTPLEAMASGAVPFCYEAGGPKEIIAEGENGYLFRTQEEVVRKTSQLIENQIKYTKMQQNGFEYVMKHFSYDIFKKRVTKLLI